MALCMDKLGRTTAAPVVLELADEGSCRERFADYGFSYDAPEDATFVLYEERPKARR
jgi:hypothetical protein